MKYLLSILTLIVTFFTVAQITANGNSGVKSTTYTDGSSNNSIFIWYGTGNNGSLSYIPISGVGPYTFNWFSYSYTSFSWNTLTTQNGTTSTLNGLANGGYRVEVYSSNGTLVGCDIAWVWNVNNQITASNTQISCGSTNLVGTNTVTPTTFTYHNPPPPQSLINANTTIKVCFTGNHTWVSDLGFFLIAPTTCGDVVITLSPNPGANGQGPICNGGNNFNNLCFTNTPSPNFNVCTASTPLTGTYDSYGPSPGTNIDFSPLIGCNAAQGGWRVQVFDCISADVGKLGKAEITFSNLTSVCGSPTTITYSSGTINSPIKDNSCSQVTASIYQVPPPIQITTPLIMTATTSIKWVSNPSVPIMNSTNINTTATNITQQTTFTLTSTLNLDGVVVSSTTMQTTYTPTTLNGYFGITHPSCFGLCDGIASVTPTSGTPPYTYNWTPSGDTQTISNLCSGTYSVVVTDVDGCILSGSVTLTNPNQLILTPINHN